MGSGLARMRAGAAIAGVSATALLMTALPANAATHGKLGDDKTWGNTITLDNGEDFRTVLMTLNLADSSSSLSVYCVDIEHSAKPVRMNERDWDDYPSDAGVTFNENREQINWILHNSYPRVGLDDLSGAVNASDDGDDLKHGKLSKKAAITATQAAIWSYSDDVALDPDASRHDVMATYNYLTGDANQGTAQPEASLDIHTDEVTGHAGELVGPVTITTNGEISNVDLELPDGVEIADAGGEVLDPAELTAGDEFYLDVPTSVGEGSAEISVDAAKTEVDIGRLFVAADYEENPAQSLIAASTGSTGSEHTATVSWGPAQQETTPPETPGSQTPSETPSQAPTETESAAPAPSSETNETVEQETEDLAYTGASVIAPALIGVGLLAAGGVAVFLVRRRQKA